MTSKSKSKGNRWELQLAEMLGSTLGGNFQRTPNSGAYTGGSNVKRLEKMSPNQIQLSRGDLIPPDHLPNLLVEAKSYASFPWHQLYDSCQILDKWLLQLGSNSETFNLLAFKIDRMGSFGVVEKKHYQMLVLDHFTFYKDHLVTSLKPLLEKNSEYIKKASK